MKMQQSTARSNQDDKEACVYMRYNIVIYVIQVSQLLMAVDNGCVNKWKDKQIKDISVEGNF